MTILAIKQGQTFPTFSWDSLCKFYKADFSDIKYKLINNKNNTYISGTLDEHGRTKRLSKSNNENHDILIGTEGEWTVSLDDGSVDVDFEIKCSCDSYEEHGDEI